MEATANNASWTKFWNDCILALIIPVSVIGKTEAYN